MQLVPELSQDFMLMDELRRSGRSALEIHGILGNYIGQSSGPRITQTFPHNTGYHLARQVCVKLSRQGAKYFTGSDSEEVYISGQLFELASKGVFAPGSGYISSDHDAITFTGQTQGVVDLDRMIEVVRRNYLGQEYKQKLPLAQALHVFNYGRSSGSYMDKELPYRMGTNFTVL